MTMILAGNSKVLPRRPRLGARIVRGLRIMRATASLAIDSAEVCDDEADDLQRAIDWLDAMLKHWEGRKARRPGGAA